MYGYPQWYINQMRELDRDLEEDNITEEEYECTLIELEQDLDEWEKGQTSNE